MSTPLRHGSKPWEIHASLSGAHTTDDHASLHVADPVDQLAYFAARSRAPSGVVAIMLECLAGAASDLIERPAQKSRQSEARTCRNRESADLYFSERDDHENVFAFTRIMELFGVVDIDGAEAAIRRDPSRLAGLRALSRGDAHHGISAFRYPERVFSPYSPTWVAPSSSQKP